MRIHIHNLPDDPLFEIDRPMWEAACARAGAIGAGHDVSIGSSDESLAAGLRDAEALITVTPAVAEKVIPLLPAGAPKLRYLFVTSAGLDRLAPFDWLPPGVALMNNRGTHSVKAAEFGLMSLLMLANRIPLFVTNQRAGRWEKVWGSVLGGRRLTIVGLGGLGGPVAGEAARFGMRVTGVRATPAPHPACARVIGMAEIDAVLPETDYLVLACPLTEATRNLMDRRRLGLLPAGAGLVNIGRGALLDQDALCDLLEAGHLSGAVLDVFTPEPVPPGHRLWSVPNLIMSPHTSVDDPATYNPVSLDIFFANLLAARDGRALPNLFDIARGY
jgi:glyoxylate/hydroxypyruvate reductase A